MSTPSSRYRHSENSYVFDAESPAELARLLHQDRFFTKALGLLPPLSESHKIRTILDLACGPGGWAMEAAMRLPGIQVTGIDISKRVVEFAQAQATSQGVQNAHFLVMNALKPLNFPDGAFDLVHGRLMNGFLPLTGWPILLQECWRVLRPGGVMCFTEAEWVITNSLISQRFSYLITEAMYRAGHGISPYSFNTTLLLQPLLRKLGCQNIQAQAHALECSAGTEAHDPSYQDIMAAAKLLQPFLIDMEVTTQAELDELYQQLPTEILSDEFYGMWLFLRAWGEKPREITLS